MIPAAHTHRLTTTSMRESLPWEERLETLLDDSSCRELRALGTQIIANGGYTGERMYQLRTLARLIRLEHRIDRDRLEQWLVDTNHYQEGTRPNLQRTAQGNEVIILAALLAEVHEVFFF